MGRLSMQTSHAAPGGYPSTGASFAQHLPSWTGAGGSTASAATGGGLFAPQANRAAKKRISIDMVGAPQAGTFVHAAHASDADQAEAILQRWGRDGMGKIADPQWVGPIKEALRMQAARNQAEAIAQIQAALHEDSVILDERSPLQVVNGVPSNFTVSTSATATIGPNQSGAYAATQPHSPQGDRVRPFQGMGIAEEGAASSGSLQDDVFGPHHTTSPLATQAPVLPFVASPIPRKPVPGLGSPRGDGHAGLVPPPLPRTNTAGTLVLHSPTQNHTGEGAPDYMRYKPSSPGGPQTTANAQGGAAPGGGQEDDARRFSKYDGMPGGMPGGIGAIFNDPNAADRPVSMVMRDPIQSTSTVDKTPGAPPATTESSLAPLGADVRPSLTTVEKSVAAKIYFENLYYGILKKPRARDSRRAGLEAELAALRISDSAKAGIRARWTANETEYLRDLRARIGANSFVKLKTIGHGAFGVVALVRERGTGELFAMKQLRKADMLRKGQEGHVRAERDLMTSASGAANARWIVKLIYSFQDVNHLYLIM